MGKGGRIKISKLLFMLLILSMSFTKLEVTGCHWDRVVGKAAARVTVPGSKPEPQV